MGMRIGAKYQNLILERCKIFDKISLFSVFCVKNYKITLHFLFFCKIFLSSFSLYILIHSMNAKKSPVHEQGEKIMYKSWKRNTKYGLGIVILLILLGFLWGGVEENMVEEVPIAEPVTRMDLERSLLDSVAGFSGPIEPKIQFALLEEFEVEPELVFSSGFWMGLGIAGSAMGLVLGTILGSKALEESKKRSRSWKKHPNWHPNREKTHHEP